MGGRRLSLVGEAKRKRRRTSRQSRTLALNLLIRPFGSALLACACSFDAGGAGNPRSSARSSRGLALLSGTESLLVCDEVYELTLWYDESWVVVRARW